MKKISTIIRSVAIPLSIFVGFLIFALVYRSLGLPSDAQLLSMATIWFAHYGYFIVFVGGLLEATPYVNYYAPGSTIIVLAVAFSRTGNLNVFLVLAIASLAFILGYLFDYVCGRYGWYALLKKINAVGPLERASEQLAKRGWRWLWITYVHPDIGCWTATAAGLLRLPLRMFFGISVAAVLTWNAFWGIIAYYGAGTLVHYLDTRVFVGLLGIWVVYRVIKGLLEEKKPAV